MRLVVMAGLVLLASPALGQGRFEADNPWFQDFEATCRQGDEQPPIAEECRIGVLMGWGAYTGYTNGECDWYMFWEAADALSSPTFDVLPWQTAVEAIFQNGVCFGYTIYDD
ncbi:hypothetical protein ACFOOL_14900 [Devosia honganensis]|uniref:Uncharacterized protein n=1 Tax=Devosia honganensis TaxID=1610527 RepID=A0ABV7X648_9HYPH